MSDNFELYDLLEKEDNETVIRTFTPSGVNLGTIRFGGYLADSSYVASALAGILNAAVGA